MENFKEIFNRYLLAKLYSIKLFCFLYDIDLNNYLIAIENNQQLDVMLNGTKDDKDLEEKYFQSRIILNKLAEELMTSILILSDDSKREIYSFLDENVVRISSNDSSLEEKISLSSYCNFMTYLKGTIKQKTL